MRRLILGTCLLFCLAAGAAGAEVKLEHDEISKALSNATLYAGTAGEIEQVFQPEGLTFFTDHGAMSQGKWKVDGDRYCSQWPPAPGWSCYDVLQDGDAIIFVNGSSRYPMRPAK